MHKKAMKWLLNLLDDEELNHLANKASIIVPGYRPGQAPRGKLIQALTLSKAFPNIVKDLKHLFVDREESYDALSEIEVTRLLQDKDTNIPALLYNLAFHVDPIYKNMAESVLEEANRRGEDDYVKNIKLRKEDLEDKELVLNLVAGREADYQKAVRKGEEQAAKLSKAQEKIDKLRQFQKTEKEKAITESGKLTANINLITKNYETLKKSYATLEGLLKQKDQENERLRVTNTELNELNRLLELDIQVLETRLIETQETSQEVAAAVSHRMILIGGKTAETLSRQSSVIQFLQEDDLNHIKGDFFDEYDQILLPLYNNTTMTQIRLSQIAATKVIPFGTHQELIQYLKGVI